MMPRISPSARAKSTPFRAVHDPKRLVTARSRDLERLRDPEPTHGVGSHAGDRAATVAHPPGGRRLEPGDHVEERALAGAVRADDAQDLALGQGEVHAVQSRQRSEALGDGTHLEKIHAVASRRRRTTSRMPVKPAGANSETRTMITPIAIR